MLPPGQFAMNEPQTDSIVQTWHFKKATKHMHLHKCSKHKNFEIVHQCKLCILDVRTSIYVKPQNNMYFKECYTSQLKLNIYWP